ncbi:xanthine dehydrogenase family protein molybdopterin-binding subunit [Sulfurimonas sp. HSL3-7]|uniref:xanthine dehydrogenase family protein molybdopterin-binding subunit n=1 Tax=Sulfonitrofixus jiaomeiensis TaxID=3131938 RepID=UPI0031F76EB4
MSLVGQSVVRVDAASKSDGTLEYTDDLDFEGLYGAVVRSTIAHGNILSITFDETFDFSDFVIVDHRDIEGRNANVMLTDDQPFLAETKVRFIGEPILLLAHRSQRMLKEALKHIDITYEPLTPVLTVQESLDCKTLLYGDDNLFKTIRTEKGEEPDYTALKSLEKHYSTPHQEQLYMETQSMIARYCDGAVRIVGSMQCPFYVESALFALTGKKIEVEQAPTGGGFGGKEDYPSLIAAYVYLLSKKAKQDVKLVYDRAEDISFTTKRHPSALHYKSHFDETGKLHALDIEITLDGGAYVTLTPVVLARAVLHAAGFYDCGYIKVDARAVATNTPPNGAFRGFGAPQVIFGIERHMDDIARCLGISPMEVRERNLPHSRSVSVTGAKIGEYTRLRTLFETTRKASGFDEKEAAGTPYKGIGMALFMHGGGFTGEGETLLASKVWLDLHDNGMVEIRIGSVEMGQGTLTALPQIVADVLALPITMIRYHLPNTAKVADSGPTVASRTVMIVGELLREAANALKEALGRYGSEAEYLDAVRAYLKSGAQSRFQAAYQKPDTVQWDEEHFYGNGYDGYSLGCYVAEVEVDPVDYRVRVSDFYAYNDVGKVVNPMMAEGQVEGGVAQGIGYALYERIAYQDGKLRSSRLSDYSVPLAADLPKLHIAFLNTDEPSKGLGELPMDGPAAAIGNALTHALDTAFDNLTITPEVVEQKCR